jgi:hypothetical protein
MRSNKETPAPTPPAVLPPVTPKRGTLLRRCCVTAASLLRRVMHWEDSDADLVVEGLNCLAAKTDDGLSINNDLCKYLWSEEADAHVPDALWMKALQVLERWMPHFTDEEGADTIRSAIAFINSQNMPCGGAQQAVIPRKLDTVGLPECYAHVHI